MMFSDLLSGRQSNRSRSRRVAQNRRKALHQQRGRFARMEQLEDRQSDALTNAQRECLLHVVRNKLVGRVEQIRPTTARHAE